MFLLGLALVVGLILTRLLADRSDFSAAAPKNEVLNVSAPQQADPSASSMTARPENSDSPEPANIAEPAPSQVPARAPTTVRLPRGTTMPVRPVTTLPSGELELPANTDRAGWWDGSSKLGEPFGATVLAAHVDSFAQGIGKVAELLEATRGDSIRLSASGVSQQFTVTSAALIPKATLSATSDLFAAGGDRRLVLITCGGEYDSARGGYQENMVVVATPEGPPLIRP